MRLPFHLVTLILFAVTATATPPPGHVHRPSDDKNPPNYQYGYEIGDVAGKESQGKVETRSGELASGRYYVNEEKSSTDVKYFADEWGYHPLVKYSAADDHSSATAHFALGEHVVKALLNGTEVGEEVKLPVDKRQSIHHNRQQPHRRRRPAQVVQPYTPGSSVRDTGGSPSSPSAPKSQPIDDHEPSATASPVNLQLNYDLQRTFSRGSKFQDASTASSTSVFRENFNNYVTLPRTSANDRDHQRQSDVRAAYLSAGSSSSTTPDYRSLTRASIYVTNPSTTGSPLNGLQVDSHQENHDSRHESSNDLFSTLSDDLLLVQNAGSFGRRLNPASHLANVIESVTQRLPTDLPQRAYSSTTPRVSHPSDLEDRRHFSTTPIPDFHDIANSVSAETLSKEYKNSLNRESSITGSYADIFSKIFSNGPTAESPPENSRLVRYETNDKNATVTHADRATTPGLSAYGKRRDHELYVTLRESLDSEIRDLSRLYSSTPQTLSTFSSKPIVVAELLNYNQDKAFEYSTTFPCTDESYPSSTTVASVSSTDESSIGFSDQILVTPKLQQSSASLAVPNPVQGLSSFPKDEPIASNSRSRATPAPVKENIEGEGLNVEPLINFSASRINELEKTVNDRYETINPAFGQPSGSEVMDIAESMKYTDQGGSSVGSDSRDQRIEIQKSVEIYQNSPVQEIHYPPQVISQVSGINQQVQQEDSVGTVHQREEQSRSYVELQEAGNTKQSQQRYNGLHDQQHQSISGHSAFEDGQEVRGTATVYRGNPVRVGNELMDYGAEQRNPPVNNVAGREDHRQIKKIIRVGIPEVKYTPVRTPQINVQVYGSAVREGANKGQAMETKPQEAGGLREEQIKAAPAIAEAQANKVQSQLHRILSESGGVQHYFNGPGWTRYQEQKQGNQQGQKQGNQQEQKQGNQQEQKQGNQQEQKQGNQQEQKQGNQQEQKQGNQQEQKQGNQQEQKQGNQQEQKQGNQQEQNQGNQEEQKQEQNQENGQEQKQRNQQEQKQENQQEQKKGNQQEQKQGNQQEQQQGHWQKVESGHWKEQQQGHWQEVEPGHWKEQQLGNRQEQQPEHWQEVEPGHWKEQQLGNRQEKQQGTWQEVEPGHWKEQQLGNRQEKQQGPWQEVEPGHWKEQQLGNRQEKQQGPWQEVEPGHWKEQQLGNRQEKQQGPWQEVEPGHWKEQQLGNRQEKQQGPWQEVEPGHWKEQQLGHRPEKAQGSWQEVEPGHWKEQQLGNRQEKQQGTWQEVEPGHWKEQQLGNRQEQQHGTWQEVEPGHWKEQQLGNRQEQQQGTWQEVEPGHWKEQPQGNRQEQQQQGNQGQQQGNRQEKPQGQRQEQQQGQRQEQQQGQRQEQQQGNRQEQQQGNQQEQQQGQRQEQQQGSQESGKLEILRSMPEVHQQQSIILPYDQYDSSEKNLQQNYGNAVQEITQSRQMAPVSYLPPPVVERIVHKTIHVPQPYPVEVPRIIEKKVPYPVEKIVERKVPYPVEKIVEKKVPVPQPYPVHIQVPVDRIIEKQVLQPYPVHIEKIIEKKVPYPVQRLVPQPYPVHILQPYPVEKIVEKPVHIPVTVEKIVEKKVHVPHPYPVQVPIKVPYPVEITKYVEQSVQVPYGVRYGVSYQQIMKPQSTNGLYGHQESTSLPIYGLSLVSNRDRINASHDFQGYTYSKPAVAFVTGRTESGNPQRSNGWEQFAYGKSSVSDNHHNQAFAKKSYVGQSPQLPQFIHNYPVSNKRQATYRQNNVVGVDKAAGKDEYVGPVPAVQQTQSQSPSKPHQKSRSRSSSDHQQTLLLQPVQQHSTSVTRTAPVSTSASSSRRARQQDENPPHYQSGPGAFRQSKIEYGFKPPMVPSIQYDEKTATKVDN